METYGTAVATLIIRGDGSNYEEWKVRMKTYLLSQDLWKDVQQTDEPFPGRGRENYMALHVIQNSCGPQAFSVIKDISLARKAWKTLADTYGEPPIPDLDQDTLEENMSENNLSNFASLYNAVREGSLKETRRILGLPDADDILWNQRIPDKGETALHTAVTNGHMDIVKELVGRMSPESLAIHDNDGYTALITAAVLGKEEMVDYMLGKDPGLISIRSNSGDQKNLPVVMAINSGQIAMARYLFHDYHIKKNKIIDREDATQLLTRAIYTKTLDIALVLIQRWPSLALALVKYEDRADQSPILALVSISQSFPSGNQLGFWKQRIFSCMRILLAPLTSIHTHFNVSNDISGRGIPSSTPPTSEIPLYVIPSGDQSNQENQNNRSDGDILASTDPPRSETRLDVVIPSIDQSNQENQNNRAGKGIPTDPSTSGTCSDSNPSSEDQSNQEDQNNRAGMRNPSAPLPSQTHLNGSNEEQWQSNINQEEYKRIKQLYEMKKIHDLYNELLSRMYEVISESNFQQLEDGLVYTAICRAAKNGIFEFVSKILEMDRRFLWTQDRNQRNIFMLAVLHRQEKIFSILHGLDRKMIYSLTSALDVYENNMLHMAGMIEDSSSVNQIPGEAMQMQRELQWFKAVERIVPPNAKENTNKDGLTPQKLFTENHKDMMKKGEKWMKSTASSCSVVGALIVTIAFSAAFTLPGGNKQETGLPFFLKNNWFRVFMIFDALSFFFSLTSVVMFLGILTSRYAEDDFLVSLPRKMIIGLSTLFCSIVTMMITFSCALLIILHGTLYIAIPLICLAGFPVTCFSWMQFPILKDTIKSTRFPSILDGKTNIG